MAYIVNAEIPKHCNKCPFGILKFSKPLSDRTHGYTCNLEVPVEGSNKTTMITDYNADIEKPDWCPLQTVSDKEETNTSYMCEWREIIGFDYMYIKNPHTNRLYSNEQSMKNIYCNTCGKKIKVVE